VPPKPPPAAAGSVRLLAVSKTFPASAVPEAYATQRAFGENYVQELQAKAAELAAGYRVALHRAAAIQQNPHRGRNRALGALYRAAEDCPAPVRATPGSLPPLQVCMQVNVSGEPARAAVPAGSQGIGPCGGSTAESAAARLMCIPEPTEDAKKLAGQFALLQPVAG
jgi:uncharacterized pyridoxal phosphate-containing UPF0001 family protein